LSLWAEVPIIPTENLSMIIIDGISSYFEATDQVCLFYSGHSTQLKT